MEGEEEQVSRYTTFHSDPTTFNLLLPGIHSRNDRESRNGERLSENYMYEEEIEQEDQENEYVLGWKDKEKTASQRAGSD